MSDSKEIKFPLSKKAKAEFSAKYEQIYFKKPVHNISDEKLVEMVNANLDKIPNAENQKQPSQEGIQDGEDQIQTGDDANDANAGTQPEGTGVQTLEGEDEERNHQLEQFKKLNGVDADENLSTDELKALNLSAENLKTLGGEYFDLFGKKPLPEMTAEQIDSANQNERKRQNDAREQEKAKAEPTADELQYNPDTEMIVVNKKDNTNKRVINKGTFDFLKHDWEAVTAVPKEIQNFK